MWNHHHLSQYWSIMCGNTSPVTVIIHTLGLFFYFWGKGHFRDCNCHALSCFHIFILIFWFFVYWNIYIFNVFPLISLQIVMTAISLWMCCSCVQCSYEFSWNMPAWCVAIYTLIYFQKKIIFRNGFQCFTFDIFTNGNDSPFLMNEL